MSVIAVHFFLSIFFFFCCSFGPYVDQKAVAATTIVWKETVTSGTYDAPKKTAALYAEDGVLWGTVSEEVRDTPEQIYAYFVSFLLSLSSHFVRGVVWVSPAVPSFTPPFSREHGSTGSTVWNCCRLGACAVSLRPIPGGYRARAGGKGFESHPCRPAYISLPS